MNRFKKKYFTSIIISAVYLLVSVTFSFSQEEKKINLFKDHYKFGVKEKLGNEINTPKDEAYPVLSPDGTLMYFVRQNIGTLESPEGKDDIMTSKIKYGNWTSVEKFKFENDIKDKYQISASCGDNNLLLLRNLTSFTSPESPDLAFTLKTSQGWSDPIEIKIDDFYNASKYLSCCLSFDGKTMIISLDGKNTEGSEDLYVCFKKNNTIKEWSRPVNLGKVINSVKDEYCPSLSADGKTLYFSSYSHPGYGEADIFLSKRLDDTWTNWSLPENLGSKINTKGIDSYFSAPAGGAFYFSSDGGTGGDMTIYRIRLAEDSVPAPCAHLFGKIFNSKTKAVVKGQIQITDKNTGKVIHTLNSGDKNGNYSITLYKPGEYIITCKQEGFIFIHKTIEIKEIKQNMEVLNDIPLTPIEKGQTVVLSNISFTANKSDLLPESNAELDKLVKIMKDNPLMKILISGHTSQNTQGEKFNQDLSTNRALAVKNYLVTKGIQSSRIDAKGFGFSKPLFTETDEEHLNLNRRVEITILSK